MIYITGDTHGEFGNVAHFCEQAQTEKSDILIILLSFYSSKSPSLNGHSGHLHTSSPVSST